MIKQITIKTDNEESKCKVRDSIHKQLVGNKDYIDCNIVLNDHNYESDENQVNIYFSENVKDESEILKKCLSEL